MGGKVDLGFIKEAGRSEIVKSLNSIPGPKAIVWDKTLAGTFGLIGDFTFLRNHDVTKMFYISNDPLPVNNIPNIIFLTKPTREQMDLINQQVRREIASSKIKKEYHLWCVPRITLLAEERLKQQGIYGDFTTIHELPVYIYYLENDLATLELPRSYHDLYMDCDHTGLFYVARALMTIQGVYGIIPNIYGKGLAAKHTFELMVSMRRELGGNEPQVPPLIDQLILVDRAVDLLTPLATQLTYEGLIDQFFGISNSKVKLPAEKFTSTRADQEGSSNDFTKLEFNELKTVNLSSSDPLYSEIRDLNFFAVAPRLSTEAREMSSQYEKRRAANTVSDLKQFVQKLPKMQVARQSLSTQTAIAELVQDKIMNSDFRPYLQVEQDLLKGADTDRVNSFVEECISQKEPLIKVLRLICLQSIINCGLKQKVFDFYKKEIVNTYGIRHLLTIENLEKAGLMTVQQGKSTYSTVRKTLRLTVDDVNESKPTDISYVHSGYAPLSVRLVEFLQCPGWRAITDVLSVLPGPTLSETQQLPPALRKRRGSGNSIQSVSGEPSTALVCFVGGCTYSEIAALRFLTSKLDQGGPEYVVLTTNIVNGSKFLESLIEPISKDNFLFNQDQSLY